jgi:hypothetical protein
MSQLEPRLSQFGPAFAWLLDKDVSSARIASLFETTSANVRVIAFRARHTEAEAGTDVSALGVPPPQELAGELGIRATQDHVVRTPVGARKLARIRNEIDRAVIRYSNEYRFLDGVASLRGLAPLIGYAGDSRRIALAALLHQHIAWFFVHAGRCDSAAREAALARNLWRRAFHESGKREYGEYFVRAALIGSHAWLLARRPRKALNTLEMVDSATESIRLPLGSDYFRQRGVALFQLREDDRAKHQFYLSTEAMKKLNEAKNPVQLLMTGSRHINLLGSVNCDRAQELLHIARQTFGDSSLEASMCMHWAASCGLSTDSPSAIQQAAELLDAHPGSAPQFGHQVTIRKLLSVASELGFDARLRQAWVRRALYENAFRDR